MSKALLAMGIIASYFFAVPTFAALDQDGLPVFPSEEVFVEEGESTAPVRLVVSQVEHGPINRYYVFNIRIPKDDLGQFSHVGHILTELILDPVHPNFEKFGKHFRIIRFDIYPAFQGQKIGQKAMAILLQFLRASQIGRVKLEVDLFNLRARHVYEKFGFKMVGWLGEALPKEELTEDWLLFTTPQPMVLELREPPA